MRSYKVEGIIIKRRDYNEADRLVTIITKDGNKQTVKASGVRRISSRRASHIELLNHSHLTLYQGPHITMLTEAQTITSYELIKNDLEKVGLAYHMCELIDGLCPENEENPAVFTLFKDTLHRLSAASSGRKTLEANSVDDYSLPAEEAYLARVSDWKDKQNRGGQQIKGEEMLYVTHEFEVELLTLLGFWNRPARESQSLDTQNFIENLLERKLKSRRVFGKLH